MQALVVRFSFCLRLFLTIGVLPHPLPDSLSVWVLSLVSEFLPSSGSLSSSRWIRPAGSERGSQLSRRSTNLLGPQEPRSSLPGNP